MKTDSPPFIRNLRRGLMLLAALFCLTGFGHAGTERVLTAKDGRTVKVRLIAHTPNGIKVRRADNPAREYTISLDVLSLDDRQFLATWEPSKHEWKPSSVQVGPSSFAETPEQAEAQQPRRPFFRLRPRQTKEPRQTIIPPDR